MPKGVNERVWKRAKAEAEASGEAGNYAYVMSIYQRMMGVLEKARKGEQVAGSKYISRKPDGKGGWTYRYRRHQVKIKGRRGDILRELGGETQMPLPYEESPSRVGPVTKDMTRDQAEAAIKDQRLEHLVAFVDKPGDTPMPQGQVYRAQGTTSAVPVPANVIAAWRANGEVTVTHNHPSGASLSIEDIFLAIGADLAEIRAVTKAGGVWSMSRPRKGWGHEDGLDSTQVRNMLQSAKRVSQLKACSRMDEVVRAAGGNPADGPKAKGFTQEVWDEIWTEQWFDACNAAFRAGVHGPKLEWEIEYSGPPRFGWQRDRARRQLRRDEVLDAARKGQDAGGGLGDVVTKALTKAGARPPGRGWMRIPKQRVGSRPGWRRWGSGRWDYKYDDEPTSQPSLYTPKATHFWSGSSRANNIRAARASNLPIGVVAGELSPQALEALRDNYGEPGSPAVFVDSGEFNAFRSGRTIPDSEWDDILDQYDTIARSIGESAHVVAPDAIGDQAETLRRMRRSAERLYDLTVFGSKVLVPLQGGDIPIREFAEAAFDSIGAAQGDPAYVPAFPMKAKALELDAAVEYLREERPPAVHFLGLGMRSTIKAPDGRRVVDVLLDTVRRYSPDTRVTMDSNVMRAKLGRGRVGTVALAEAREQMIDEAAPTVRSAGDESFLTPGGLERVMNAVGAPHMAFTSGQLRSIARRAGLRGDELQAFARAPHRYRTDDLDLDRKLNMELERAAFRLYFEAPLTGEAQTRQYRAVVEDIATAKSFRDVVADALEKKLRRPPGRGWGRIPKPRGGKLGWRRPDGKGGYEYRYDEDLTGQLGLFSKPAKDPVASHREYVERLREEARALLYKGGKQRITDDMFNPFVNTGVVSTAFSDIYDSIDVKAQLTLRKRELAIGLKMAAKQNAEYNAWLDRFTTALHEHPSVSQETRDAGRMALDTEGLPYAVREKLMQEFFGLWPSIVEDFKALASGSARDRLPVAYTERFLSEAFRALDLTIEPMSTLLEDYTAEEFYILTEWVEGNFARSRDPKIDKELELAPWGTAHADNHRAALMCVLGDKGRYRPHNLGLKLSEVGLSDFIDETSDILRSEKRLLEETFQQYNYAQSRIGTYSREDYPAAYRGLVLPMEAVRGMKAGDRLTLTGCTAFSFSRSVATSYAQQGDTSGGNMRVLFVVERDDVFDASISGMNNRRSAADTDDAPVYEAVSGGNGLVITGVSQEDDFPGGVVVRARVVWDDE